jgi:hypothetical protein
MRRVKIQAIANTHYQLSSLNRFNLENTMTMRGNIVGEGYFNTLEEAEEYLITRAQMYYDESPGQADEHIEQIKKYGSLEIDAVTAYIHELKN